MCYAVMFAALSVNFYLATPTFLVYHVPNYVWATCFAVLAVGKFVFLNCLYSLVGMRVMTASALSFLLFFAAGTTEPFLLGSGSLQLPIVYFGLAIILFPVLVEPFINPWTALRDEDDDS